MMMWGWHTGWSWADWAAMGSMMIMAAVVLGVIVWAVAWSMRSSTSHRSFETPRAVLDRRLAAGEISEDEYARARRLIEDHAAHTR